MAELVTYSAPAFWPRCPHYYVEVNGQEVPVHPVRVSAMVVNELYFGDQREIEQTELAGMQSGGKQIHIILQKILTEGSKYGKLTVVCRNMPEGIGSQCSRCF